jgi:oxaloacetate decarboxylase gamma subunit
MTEAFKLMLTGMGTVFFILIMVVLLGNAIIRITNKFSVDRAGQVAGLEHIKLGVEPAKVAAIISAVEITTKGKGKVTSIQKLNN